MRPGQHNLLMFNRLCAKRKTRLADEKQGQIISFSCCVWMSPRGWHDPSSADTTYAVMVLAASTMKARSCGLSSELWIVSAGGHVEMFA